MSSYFELGLKMEGPVVHGFPYQWSNGFNCGDDDAPTLLALKLPPTNFLYLPTYISQSIRQWTSCLPISDYVLF